MRHTTTGELGAMVAAYLLLGLGLLPRRLLCGALECCLAIGLGLLGGDPAALLLFRLLACFALFLGFPAARHVLLVLLALLLVRNLLRLLLLLPLASGFLARRRGRLHLRLLFRRGLHVLD